MGLLDQGAMMSPEMGMAMGLLSAGGPSRMPVSLGQGLAQGYQGYQQAQQLHAEQKMRDMQIQQQQEQIAMARHRQEEAKRRQEAMAKILSNPAIPQHIREGVAAGAIDIGDLYKPQKLGEGDSLVSPIQSMMGRDGVIAQGAPRAAAPTDMAKLIAERDKYPMGDQNRKLYDAAIAKQTTHAPASSIVNYGGLTPGVDTKTGRPVFIQPSNRGGAPNVIRDIAPAGQDSKPPTEFEAKAGLYFKSMRQASTVLDDIENNGNPRVQPVELIAPGQDAKNVVRSKERNNYVQAQRQWIDSINRVRSGANLPEIEYERAVMTFFPQFGDPPETIKQKSVARKQEEEAMSNAAGRALPKGSQQPGGIKFLGFEKSRAE